MEILYPPHPCDKIIFSQLNFYEASNKWVAQRKFNGTRTVIHINNGKIDFFTRHGVSHIQFKVNDDIKKEILLLNLKKNVEYWLDGEILDSKTNDIFYKNKIVLFDVLFENRLFLGNVNLESRLELLRKVCNNPRKLENHNQIALEVSKNIWMAETFKDNFLFHFNEKNHLKEIEGLVLKKLGSKILNFYKKNYLADWFIRCRKEQKNYIF